MVAPELAGRGWTGTGTVETGITGDTTRACIHGKQTLMASWADLAMLRDSYGWSFVSHSRTYAKNWSTMTSQQQLSETCGSLDDLRAHGHNRGDGLFAYPDNSWSDQVQIDGGLDLLRVRAQVREGRGDAAEGHHGALLGSHHPGRRRPLQQPGAVLLDARHRDVLPLARRPGRDAWPGCSRDSG